MKRLVICSDGTWGTPDSAIPSNVVTTARSVLPISDDGTHQVVFYDWGIGSDSGQRLRGGALGRGIDKNIMDAYRFLVHNYVEGDEIYLFGFSRGAYTVRSLIGMVRKCGLLYKGHSHKVLDAYEVYRSKSAAATGCAENIRKLSRPVEITFLGVWDTVCALGIPWLSQARYRFHDTQLSSIVRYACHALASDEKRRIFSPTLWQVSPDRKGTEQRWFPGEHSDVGGGTENRHLSHASLSWVLSHAQEAGLEFHLSVFVSRYPEKPHKKSKINFISHILGKPRSPLSTSPDETI